MFSIILEKTLQHLFISFCALFIATAIAIPLGLSLSRCKNQKLALWIIRLVSLIQTMPGLAMIAAIVIFLVSIRSFISLPTIGFLPGVLSLSLYAISPIVTNTFTGINQISPPIIDVAKGLGMTSRQILLHVEIPHATSMIMAGVRIAGVWTIGMCALTSFVGSGGLGDLILQGLRSMNPKLVLAGTVPAAILAIFFEIGMSRLEVWIKPDRV